ncbi:MAG TPA: phospholipase D-like domain-containing protein [Gemmatimonadaceae bacterium]|nr:phospholipase D-like domain-containing protein [Gemmatimonadaceae bacterium]
MPTTARPRQRAGAPAQDRHPVALDGPPESIEWLIDNAEAYARLLQALRGARRSVRIAQLALDADCVAFEQPDDVAGAPSPRAGGDVLAETLCAIGARGDLEVSVLLNATLLLDTAKSLRRFLASVGAHGIQLRGVGHFPRLLHAKMIIIDGTDAFLIGSPFVNGYWDDRRHRPVDPRRPRRELAGRPLHDVSVRVTGPVVDGLDAMFCELWNDAPVVSADETRPLAPHRTPASMPSVGGALRLVRTLSPGASPGMPEGATEILDACLDAIDSARSLIYIEQQYLSARPVVAALAAALRREPALEIVAVLNQNPDITAYRAWQTARLAEWGLLEHPRVGVFALWSTEPRDTTGRLAINQVFVHSKVLAIDDRWATIGSANLDGVSLHSYGDDFQGWLGRRLFRGVRNVEANVVVDEMSGGVRLAGAVADLRRRLWSEHLGMSDDDVAEGRSGPWLELWRQRASGNVAALNAGLAAATTTSGMRGFVLPYSPRAAPAEQLADVGVCASSAGLDLCFDPGWLELHLSPYWVRNMFS